MVNKSTLVRPFWILILSGVLALLGGSLTADAKLYRWRDAQGVLHVSDTPPMEAGVDAEAVPGVETVPDTGVTAVPPETPPKASPEAPPASLEGLTAGPFVRGLLWKVTAPGGQVSHILGTIHSDDPRVLNLPEGVKAALDKSDVFMMEVLITSEAILKLAHRMMLSGSDDLESILGAGLFDQAARAMETRGIPRVAVGRLKPWVVAMMLCMPESQSQKFLDLELHRRAVDAQKTIHGMESVEEQMDIFDHLPLDRQIDYLKETLELLPQMPAMFESMISAYLDRDLQGLARIVQEVARASKSMPAEGFMERINDNRNTLMVKRMTPHLQTGGAFVAVGALHLAGEQGILNLLSRQGYGITAMDDSR
jgi:uncharacterized protein YbaP (TraB family)